MASHTSAKLEHGVLNIKPLPRVQGESINIPVVSIDDQVPCFPEDILETLEVPGGWSLHFDIISGMRGKIGDLEEILEEPTNHLWTDFMALIESGVRLSGIASHYSWSWNNLVDQSFTRDQQQENEDGVVHLQLKSGAISLWNTDNVQSKMELYDCFLNFLKIVQGRDMERRVKTHFARCEVGDGESWWSQTVSKLLDQVEECLAAPATLEKWLDEVRSKLLVGQKVEIWAKVISASTDRKAGTKLEVADELVFSVTSTAVERVGTFSALVSRKVKGVIGADDWRALTLLDEDGDGD